MHFLLELLQNADDNLYSPSIIPKMRIIYRDGTLRFDTNEIGFRKTDVEAICSIGHSSKQESQPGMKRIGEKGIGFKSVFGVAGSVFITSGHYSFMFSNKEPLGRLAPVWAEFPENRHTGFTSILLELHQTLNPDALVRELKSLDGRLLMFLQNLKDVEIDVFAHYQSSILALRRQDSTSAYRGFQSRIVQPDHFSPYLLFRYPVLDLPPQTRRKGRTESEIVLAFPSKGPSVISASAPSERRHLVETHKVYAFLPIRDYGFKVCPGRSDPEYCNRC